MKVKLKMHYIEHVQGVNRRTGEAYDYHRAKCSVEGRGGLQLTFNMRVSDNLERRLPAHYEAAAVLESDGTRIYLRISEDNLTAV